jgi:hypothetical protein
MFHTVFSILFAMFAARVLYDLNTTSANNTNFRHMVISINMVMIVSLCVLSPYSPITTLVSILFVSFNNSIDNTRILIAPKLMPLFDIEPLVSAA